MANFLTDTFTDTNSTSIASHTPDSGGTWSLHSGTAGTIQSNRATGGGGVGYYFHSQAAAADGESVEASLKLVPSGTDVILILRASTASGGSFYMLWWTMAGATLKIWRKVNGSFTPASALATLTGFTPTGDHTMKFTVSGTGATVTLEGFMDGTSKGTYADTDASRITNLGAAGFGVFGSASAGYMIDSITAADSSSAASSLILPRAGRRQQHLLVR